MAYLIFICSPSIQLQIFVTSHINHRYPRESEDCEEKEVLTMVKYLEDTDTSLTFFLMSHRINNYEIERKQF